MYNCKRCGYSTTIKCNLKSHFNRKKICPNIHSNVEVSLLKDKLTKMGSKMNPNEPKMNPNESKMNPNESKMNPNEPSKYMCQFCKNVYSTNSNLNKHMKKCTKVNVQENALAIKQYSNELSKIKKEVEKLVNNMAVSNVTSSNNTISNKTNSSNKNSHNNLEQNNNITINNYGKENLDYITGDYLTSLLKIPYSSIPNLVKNIHFNPKHPENRNIKIPNRKEKFATVYNSGSWELKNKKEVIESIVDNSYNIIECHYDDMKEYLEENKKYKFLLFKDKYDENGKTKKNVETDTELIILNSSKE